MKHIPKSIPCLIKRFFFLFSLLMALPCPLFAINPVSFDDTLNRVSFGQQVEFLEDKDKKLLIDDIVGEDLKWLPSKKKNINLGLTSSAYWFRFTLENTTSENIERYLEITYPLLDWIDLYIPTESGGFDLKKVGDHYPFHDREIFDKGFLFPIKSIPGAQTYYMRIVTDGSLKFTPGLWSPKAYVEHQNSVSPIIWILYGSVMIMCIYNILLMILIKEQSFIYLVAFIILYLLLQLSLDGLAFQYLWPESVWWSSNAVPFLISLTVIMCSLFIRAYVNTAENAPRGNKYIINTVVIPGSIWSLVSLSGNYSFSIKGAILLVLVSVVNMTGIMIWLRHLRTARFLMLAFAMLFLGIFIYTVHSLGVFPASIITTWSIQLGAVLFVGLLSLGLPGKRKVLRNHLQQTGNHI